MAIQHATSSSGIGDILERILDKGVVIAGDIKISLADVELLNIKIRLLVASVDKAREMGIDWWQHDPYLCSRAAPKALETKAEPLGLPAPSTKPVNSALLPRQGDKVESGSTGAIKRKVKARKTSKKEPEKIEGHRSGDKRQKLRTSEKRGSGERPVYPDTHGSTMRINKSFIKPEKSDR